MASSSSASASGFGGSSNGQGFGGFGSCQGSSGQGSDKPRKVYPTSHILLPMSSTALTSSKESPPTTPNRPAPVRPARVYHNSDGTTSSPIGTQYTYSPGGTAQAPTAPILPAVVLAPVPGRPQTPETPIEDGRFELRDHARDVSPSASLEDRRLGSYLPADARAYRAAAVLARAQRTALVQQTSIVLSIIPDTTETTIKHPLPPVPSGPSPPLPRPVNHSFGSPPRRLGNAAPLLPLVLAPPPLIPDRVNQPTSPAEFGPSLQETFAVLEARRAGEARLAQNALAALTVHLRPSKPQAEEATPFPPPLPPPKGSRRHPRDKGQDGSKKSSSSDLIR
ncbi:hypothetical protein BKA61DRAFT_668728 [Leptodontidium sp. MPI-SDFR-AT-0119]|nr:hypothetical protein BKA61DRAFT_668728 [Leptodontidium sp. MPI-SDFR-AT-0119]